MFQKFGKDVPQSLVDAVADIMGEAKVEPASPDKEAIERRKRLQALKDKQEDERAAKADRESDPLSADYKEKKSSGVTVRTHTAKYKPEVDEAWEPEESPKEPSDSEKKTSDELKNKSKENAKILNKVSTSFGKKNEEVEYLEFIESVYGMNEEQLDDMINEVLGKDASAGDWISDFTKSDNPKFAGKSKAQRKKMALAAYYAKQRNEEVGDVEEELKGDQHKIDANKNGKVDAHDFKLLRNKKKVTEEEIEESRGHKIVAKKLAQIARRNPLPQSDKLKDAENLKQVEIVKQKDTSVSHPQSNLDVHDQHYDLNKKTHGYGVVQHEEVEKKDDVPFDGSKPKDNVVVGKKGKGHAKASSLAKMGLKQFLKKKSEVGESESKDDYVKKQYDKTSNQAWERVHAKDKNPISRFVTRVAARVLDGTKIDRKTGKVINNEEVVDGDFKIGDRVVANGSLTGKQTGTVKKVVKMAKGNGYLVKHDDSKLDLNYPAHKLAKEEVELDETAVLDKYIRSLGYDPEKLEKNKKVMFSKTNAYKTYATRAEALYDGGQKGTQDTDNHMSPGATARG